MEHAITLNQDKGKKWYYITLWNNKTRLGIDISGKYGKQGFGYGTLSRARDQFEYLKNVFPNSEFKDWTV